MRQHILTVLCLLLVTITPVLANDCCCNFGYQQYYTRFNFKDSNMTAIQNETVMFQTIPHPAYPSWLYSTLGYKVIERTNETFNLTTDSNGYITLAVDRAMLHRITCRNTTVLLYPYETNYIIVVGYNE